MSIAKLGAFAGGLSAGINNGMGVARTKVGMDAARQEMGFRKSAADRADVFASLMKGLISGDKTALNTVKSHFGMPTDTVVDANAAGEAPRITDNQYAGSSLGGL